jgi:hypothetical protein
MYHFGHKVGPEGRPRSRSGIVLLVHHRYVVVQDGRRRHEGVEEWRGMNRILGDWGIVEVMLLLGDNATKISRLGDDVS